jgi:hypothetical protein
MSKFCTSCGTALEEGQRFCGKCGAPVKAGASAQGSGTAAQAGESAQAEPPAQSAAVNKEAEAAEEKSINLPALDTKQLKEEAAGFFVKLPFRALAEKIPAGTRAKFPLLDKAIPFANQIVCGLAVVLVVIVIAGSGGGGKMRAFTLTGYKDYIDASAVEFQKTESINWWLLADPADYKTVVKELTTIFGKPIGSDEMFADEDSPGRKQAKIGFFSGGDDYPDQYLIILQVGKDIKKGNSDEGGTVWNWLADKSFFKKGNYVLERRVKEDGKTGNALTEGKWVYESGDSYGKPETIELLKDGTGKLDGYKISWRTEGKHLVFSAHAEQMVCRYKLSGAKLTLTYDDGNTATFVKR